MTDADLIEQFIETRCEAAFREIVRRHIGLVYGAALRQLAGDTHLAQDTAQRVFVTVAAKAANLRGRADLAGWLYQAARLEAIRAVRGEQRRRRREAEAQIMNATETESTEPAVAWEAIKPVLDELMARLDATDREAVVLRFFCGKSFPEVGRLVGLSDEAARKRVDRALERLRVWLSRQGISSTGAAIGLLLEANASAEVSAPIAAAVANGAWCAVTASAVVNAGLLMGSIKLTAGVAGAVLALAAGIAYYDFASLAASQRRLALVEAQIATESGLSDSLAQQLAAAQSRAAGAAASAAGAQNLSGQLAADPVRPYLSDPVYRSLKREASLARRHLQFQRFCRQLGLTPDQTSRFESLMADQDQAQLDSQIARDEGLDSQKVFQASGEAWSKGMNDLLGASGFQQLQNELRGMAVRRFVDSLAAMLPPNCAPLTLEQADGLVQTAFANDPVYQSGKGTDPGNVNWDAAMKSAEEILLPDQLSLFKTQVDALKVDRLRRDRDIALQKKPS